MSKNKQITTESDKKTGLTPLQEQAALMLAAGHSVTEVSTDLHINRGTLYLWFEKVTFQCFLNQQCKEIQDSLKNNIFTLYDKAITELRGCLECNNPAIRLKAAIYTIEKIQNTPIGETSPETILQKRCTKDSLFEWDTKYLDEKEYSMELKKNGLI